MPNYFNKAHLGHQNSQNIIITIIIILIVIILISITIYIYLYHKNKLFTYKEKNTEGNIYYTRCQSKFLNKATIIGLDRNNIDFLRLSEIDDLEQQLYKNSQSVLIYIPCGYNNSDMDIEKFWKSHSKYLGHQNIKSIIGGVIGCNKLCSKNGLWKTLENKYSRQGASLITPETWLIPEHRSKFREYINKQLTKYKNNIIDTNINNEIIGSVNNDNDNDNYIENDKNELFILKKNIQGKRGLLLTNDLEKIAEIFSCGYNDNYVIVQRYLTNPFLINDRKLNIRLYLIVTIFNDNNGNQKQRWWLYKKGKCIYTNQAYHKLNPGETIYMRSGSNNDLEQHLTSLNLDTRHVYEIEKCPETLDELDNYLTASNNGDNKLWSNIWEQIIDDLRKVFMAYIGKLTLPGLRNEIPHLGYQLFGLDYIIADDDWKPYLLEFNKGPEMAFKSPKDRELKTGLMSDVFKLILTILPNNNDNNKNYNNNIVINNWYGL